MNIKITHAWLADYLETDATPEEIRKDLSLCGPSVESIQEAGNDTVYDIEITSNRIDTASVIGIAQECQAILPMFGKKAVLKNNPLTAHTFSPIDNRVGTPLDIRIEDPSLCPRFAAIVLEVRENSPSPAFMKERLNAVGIKSMGAVIDISNYLMMTLGQPTHVFDYDRIRDGRMIMRQSRKGEVVTTLDEKKIALPGGDIVMEDGSGELFDLCGIMGGLNSSFTQDTKRVVLFVQTYDKQRIRKTSMKTGQRTLAATFFEKGLDEELVEPTLAYGVKLLEKYAGGKVASALYDIYPRRVHPKKVTSSYGEVSRQIGVDIGLDKVRQILVALGFGVEVKGDNLEITVPSFRTNDISITEDIVEEVARVYGYHRIPGVLPPPAYVRQPPETEKLFVFQHKIKLFLKHLGLIETLNYSMISQALISDLKLELAEHLNVSNTLSEDIKYLRRSLLPSLIKNMRENEGKREVIRLFEVAKIYPKREGNLPDESYRVAIAANTSYRDLKGIVESLLNELNVAGVSFDKTDHELLAGSNACGVSMDGERAGTFGMLRETLQDAVGLKKHVYLAELSFDMLAQHAKNVAVYRPIRPFAVIKLDLTIPHTRTYQEIVTNTRRQSGLLQKVELLSEFEGKITLRFYFGSDTENITEETAKKELAALSANLS